jgi:uncharacterized protein (DUF2235 family)
LKNLVLIFDRSDPRDATNAARLLQILDDGDDQITWYHPGVRRAWRSPGTATDDACSAIADAYDFLIENWTFGDRIYVFGVGRGGYCAQTLTRLLGTVGLSPDLKDYALAAYAAPRTDRTPADWRRVTRLFAELAGQDEIAVPVEFLGIWDAVRVPGVRRPMLAPMGNVASGRHAVAIDGGPGKHLVATASERIEEAWFRGAHFDVAGGPGASWPLADITLDWVLDGAAAAGIAMIPSRRFNAPAPSASDALAGSARTIPMRRVPDDALVHSSVEMYLREHPDYWRRLPARVRWTDADWAARSERVAPTTMPVLVPRRELAALAS